MKYISGSFLISGKEIDWHLGDSDRENDEGITIGFTIYSPQGQRDALTRVVIQLRRHGVKWLRPAKGVMDKWLLNLDELKVNFDHVKDLHWAHGVIAITPEYEVEQEHSRLDNISPTVTGRIRFVVIPEEMESAMVAVDFPELKPFLEKFSEEHQEPKKCGFLMMKFGTTELHTVIVDAIKSACAIHGIEALRADDKTYSDDLLSNIRTYMHGCSFGIAVYERLVEDDFNPNVSLEVGYMMALGKPVLFLKDTTLDSLHTDLVGKLYEIFDVQSPHETIPPVLEKWLKNKSIIE
jgi:hypothetical protein